MKRKLLLGCLTPLVVIGGGVWWGVHRLMGAEPTPGRYETVDRGDVEVKVTETGTIEPLKKVEVKSKIAGRVKSLSVQEGSAVRAGQALAEIDPTEINSQVAQMQAQLDGAKARLEQARRSVLYQQEQTTASIRQTEQGLRSSEARLKMAQEDSRAQPSLTGSDVAQAEASLRVAQSSFDLMKRATHPQAVVNAQTGFDETKASAENARRNMERQQRLLAKGFVSEQVVDIAKTDYAAAQARLGQAQKRLDLLDEQQRLELADAENRVAQAQATLDRAKAGRSQVAMKRQEVLSAQAAVEQARAQWKGALSGAQQDKMRQDEVRSAEAGVRQLENQLREVQVHQYDTRIIAPMSGVVTKRYIEAGELVTSGVSTFSSGTPVVQVADLSQMLVKMSVNEVDVHKIRPGLPVEITIDGARGTVFQGHVRKVAPAALGSGTGSGAGGGDGGGQASGGGTSGGVIRFAVEVLVDRPDSRLKPGMSAKCAIVIARTRSVLRVPSGCVEGEGANAKVQVLSQTKKDGKTKDAFTLRPVVAGLRGDTYMEIQSGLQPGERIKPGAFTGPKRKGVEMNFD